MQKILSKMHIFLENSSPGLGRPLKKEKDYVRSVGKSIDIKLYKAIDKQKEFTGILKKNMEDQIVLTIENHRYYI